MTSRPLLLLTLFAIMGSCKSYTGIYYEGRYQTVIHSRKYPNLLPPRIYGTTTLVDRTAERVIERKRFKHGVSFFGTALWYERTTTYDSTGRKSKVVMVNGEKRTTVEYSRPAISPAF